MALISNDSLTPTRLDPKTVFTPNYPDNRSVIGAFRRAVSFCKEKGVAGLSHHNRYKCVLKILK